MMNAAGLLRYARKKAGLSQRQLSDRSGVAQPAISKIERGHVSPRFDTLVRLLHPCGARLALVPERGIGVDRTAIRDLLRLSPEERLERAMIEGRHLSEFEERVER